MSPVAPEEVTKENPPDDIIMCHGLVDLKFITEPVLKTVAWCLKDVGIHQAKERW